ncbi:hypothetical protein A2U01_0089178, partial [Trifolium medium]|nr:hypothetical protein [Trifolium medium]
MQIYLQSSRAATSPVATTPMLLPPLPPVATMPTPLPLAL